MEGFEFKDKTAISASEVVSYLKSLLIENSLFTFGQERERAGRLISKLHRYLVANLSNYKEKCTSDVKMYEDETDSQAVAKEIALDKSECLTSWVDFQGKKSQMFYILGPLDESAFELEQLEPEDANIEEGKEKQSEQKRKEIAMRIEENMKVHFGKVESDPIALSELHQDIRDLADKMTKSEKMSEAKNERDRKGYQITFESLIDRLGGFYKPPILSEEEIDKDVDCLKLVKSYIPPLTIENVIKLAQILKQESGTIMTDPHYNAILRLFHRIRYVK